MHMRHALRSLWALLGIVLVFAPIAAEASFLQLAVAIPTYPINGTVLLPAYADSGALIEVKVRNDGISTFSVSKPNACAPAFRIADVWGEDLPLMQPDSMCIMMMPLPTPVPPGETVLIGAWDQRLGDRSLVDAGFITFFVEATSGSGTQTLQAGMWVGTFPGRATRVRGIDAPTDIRAGTPLTVTLRVTLPDGMRPGTTRIERRVLDIRCIRAPCPSITQVALIPVAVAGGIGGDTNVVVDLGSFDPATVQLRALQETGAPIEREVQVGLDGPFIVVSASHWAAVFITDLVTRGVLNGHQNGFFYPNWSITRAEVAKVALLASGRTVDPGTDPQYLDLPATHSLHDHLLTAFHLGWLSANGTHANPDTPATRFETLKVLMDAFGVSSATTSAPAAFPDAAIGVEKDYSTAAKSAGIVSGNNGSFLPTDPVTRAEIAKMAWGLLH